MLYSFLLCFLSFFPFCFLSVFVLILLFHSIKMFVRFSCLKITLSQCVQRFQFPLHLTYFTESFRLSNSSRNRRRYSGKRQTIYSQLHYDVLFATDYYKVTHSCFRYSLIIKYTCNKHTARQYISIFISSSGSKIKKENVTQ